MREYPIRKHFLAVDYVENYTIASFRTDYPEFNFHLSVCNFSGKEIIHRTCKCEEDLIRMHCKYIFWLDQKVLNKKERLKNVH